MKRTRFATEAPPRVEPPDADSAAWSERHRLAFEGAAEQTGRLVVPPTRHVVEGEVVTVLDARTGARLSRVEFSGPGEPVERSYYDDDDMDEDAPPLPRARLELGIAPDDELWGDEPPPDGLFARASGGDDDFRAAYENDADL